MSSRAARLLITPGEPAGVGPELVLRTLLESDIPYPAAVIADPQLLRDTATRLGLVPQVHTLAATEEELQLRSGVINVLPVTLRHTVSPGQLEVANAAYVIDTLALANRLCLEKRFDAVVTGPVQKSVINDAGIPFSGHTEFFAEHSATPKVVMMLATGGLRVALATTHLPLREVPDAITAALLVEVIDILIHSLRCQFGIARPRILVAGLNPHAGEGGHLGREEIDTIIPVLRRYQGDGAELIGPLPADTLFTPKHLAGADAVLAMYHDQGLPVLKHKGFGNAVNITLGLPYIRTSVDHGTALDLAGSGRADNGSLKEALQQALVLAQAGSARP